jgi:hypothetical protein
MPERRDGDRIIVTGYSPGSHFPRSETSIPYAWEANGLGKDGRYIIPGSVYGRQLRFVGPGDIGGPILGRGDVELKASGDGLQRFLAGVAANGSVASPPRHDGLRDSLVADIRKASHVIRGDVLAQNVYLENAVIFGNVEANNVTLRHCIIFGAAIAREQLHVVASTVFYYHARDVRFEGPCALVQAMGVSQSKPEFLPYTDPKSQTWPSDLRLYPLLRTDGAKPMTNRPWVDKTSGYSQAKLYPEHDWVKRPIVEKVQRAVSGKFEIVEREEERWVLSLGGRILDLSRLGRVLDDMYTLLKSGLEFVHYDPQLQNETLKQWKSIATPDELWMLERATTPVQQADAA